MTLGYASKTFKNPSINEKKNLHFNMCLTF